MRPLEERDDPGESTTGLLVVERDGEAVFACATLELPWRGNSRSISCIPKGVYPLRHREAHESRAFSYPHFLVEDVPGRSFICIHRGNYLRDIRGCILVGRRHADLDHDGSQDVAASTETLRELRRVVPAQSRLVVRDARLPDLRRVAGVAPAPLDIGGLRRELLA